MTTTTMRNGMAGFAALVIIVISHFLQLNCTEPIGLWSWYHSHCCQSMEFTKMPKREKSTRWRRKEYSMGRRTGRMRWTIWRDNNNNAFDGVILLDEVRPRRTYIVYYVHLRHTLIHGANEILAFGRSVTDAQSNLYVKSFMFTLFVYSA